MQVGKGKILVVDDDREVVATLCDLLELAGWRAQGVYTGGEALAALRWSAYDCVLMDLKMPGMDGMAALKAMRAERPDVRVVVVTGLTEPEVRSEARRSGASHVLSKPVDPKRLLGVLEEVCGAGS